MKDYLKNSFNKAMKERKEYYLYDIPIYLLNKFPDHINIENILQELTDYLPYELISGLDSMYVGEFKEFKERDIQAFLKDGAIYISSFKGAQNITEEIIVGNIIHEVGHLAEEKFYFDLFSDSKIEKEYIGKKKRLVDLLRANGVSFLEMGHMFFSEDMVDELDDFLYKTLGYDNLIILTTGLFLSPYSVTSIREYFANGFEEYIFGDRNYLKDISPALYNKLDSLMETII
jgi:hypothetical protein